MGATGDRGQGQSYQREIVKALAECLALSRGEYPPSPEPNGEIFRSTLPEKPHLNPGDLVMVNMKNMKTKRPSKKLDHKKLGPVEIIEAIGKRAYRVKLPPQ